MEFTQHGLLEDLLAPSTKSWTAVPPDVVNQEFFPSEWSFESINENPEFSSSNPSFLGPISPTEPSFVCPFNDGYYPYIDGFTVPEISSSYDQNYTTIQIQQEYPSMVEDHGVFLRSIEARKRSCKVEMEQANTTNVSALGNVGMCGERKIKVRKVDGQPSKNLMAERRRRKRLTERLSMLRSIVPKISKMDRTSILGDAIDYMKELLEKIRKLKEEDKMEADIDQMKLMGNFMELKPNQILVRNTSKFDVERRKEDIRIEICCAPKPGLLLSTLNTLEALGLDIQHCVISCFNNFSLLSSCSEPVEHQSVEHQSIISSEDIKQALFRNSGYGGRCF